ncbi:MAG: hypothetical protein J6K20_05685 [Thermoguttaceae bacterium]|nr:hypothetical protein [Thermoguttaceae bacterium]
MNPLYPLILASGTKEALFAALWLALGEEPGRVVDATFADVRETAKRFANVKRTRSRGLLKGRKRR